MKNFFRGMLDYPIVIATLSVGLVGGILEIAGQPTAARWVIAIFALSIAALQAKGMVDGLRSGTYGIDLLAVAAITTATIVGEHWAALVVVLMLSGGEALEDYAAGRAKRELTALLGNAPQIAHRMEPGGELAEISVDDVEVGHQLLVRPFEIVPVDATLTSEAATLDESSLTGESLPVERVQGEAVMSGAINGSVAIMIAATARAEDSQYQRIIELVREAEASKAPFVRLADRVAVPFTLFALALAVTAWLVTGNPTRMAEVLVVATPCPLIIAAPVAFMAGMSRSARSGIIVKSSGTLEQLAAVQTAAFDKTGTLTLGAPRVTTIEAAADSGLDATQLLLITAAIEQYSGHPLATAIVAAGTEAGTLPTAYGVSETPAHGMAGTADGRTVEVGKGSHIQELTNQVMPLPPLGESSVYVAIDGRYAGFIALADGLRGEARATIESLHRAGVRHTMMITGDGQVVADHIAEQVGIDDVRANLLPEDKVAAIASAPNRPVLMVGDGVNDAPVLAAADVGIAMGARGSSAASESADVVIMLDDLARVGQAVLIGKRTMGVAWQAIGIGLALSIGLMLVAAFGFLPALIGAWMQELVDLAAILWALLAMRPSAHERAAF